MVVSQIFELADEHVAAGEVLSFLNVFSWAKVHRRDAMLDWAIVVVHSEYGSRCPE